MKKRVISILLAVMLAVTMCSCGSKELTQNEKATVYAVQELQSCLKNPRSMELYSVSYKVDDTTEHIFVKVEYAANNDYGGLVEDTWCFEVSDDIFSDDHKTNATARVVGCYAITTIDYDRMNSDKEYTMEIDRVLENIDMEI